MYISNIYSDVDIPPLIGNLISKLNQLNIFFLMILTGIWQQADVRSKYEKSGSYSIQRLIIYLAEWDMAGVSAGRHILVNTPYCNIMCIFLT